MIKFLFRISHSKSDIMKGRAFLLIIFISLSRMALGQDSGKKSVTGLYADGLGGIAQTELELREDHTFKLINYDPVFSYTYQTYTTKGEWEINGNEITLNPDKLPRKKEIDLRQNYVDTESDSLLITLNYFIDLFENEEQVSRERFDFDMFTLYINKERHYYHIVQSPKIRTCGFAPKIRHQVVIDSLHQFRLAKTKVERIGLYSYGFDEIIWLEVEDEAANHFDLTVYQPVDKERTPRNKKVILKKGRAYFYERNGKVDTSWLANALIKKT